MDRNRLLKCRFKLEGFAKDFLWRCTLCSHSRLYPLFGITLLTVTIFLVRFHILGAYPPSEDLGAQLVIAKTYFHGLQIKPQVIFHYPPLYPLLLTEPLILVFPTFLATKLEAVLASSIIAIPFFLASRAITKNNNIAFVATLLFTFSEGYSEMIGWGGIGNLLGIFFMLFSLYFLFQSLNENSWKKAILAGIFLSFTAGTHHLSFIYYAAALVISVILLIVIKAKPLRDLAKIAIPLMVVGALLSVPYLSVYEFMIPQRVNVATGIPQDIGALFFNMFWSILAIARSNAAIVILLGIAFISFANLCRSHNPKAISVLILSLGITILLLLSLFHPDIMGRVYYFLYIPVFLAFGILISDVLKQVRSKKLLKLSLYALLAILIFFWTSTAYYRMIEAKNYYQLLDDETVAALNWLKLNTASNSIVLANYNMLPGWIEGYAERKTFSSRELGFIVTSLEYNETLAANKMLAGNHLIMNPHALVSDYFPSDIKNPAISVLLHGWYREIIYFSDAYGTFSFLQNSTETQVTIQSASTKTMENVTEMGHEASVTYRYTWDFGSLTREVQVINTTKINVIYHLQLSNTVIKRFDIPVCVPSINKVGSHIVDGGKLTLAVTTPYGDVENLTVSLLGTTCDSFNVTFKTTDPILESSAAFFALHVENSEVFAKFQVSTNEEVKKEEGSEYVNTQELLKTYNISYIVLDKTKFPEQVSRFASERNKYRVVFENDKLSILKVNL